MIRYYLIFAWRNLLKNKLVSTINITGLAVGISAAILAALYAHHELSFESYHKKADRIASIFSYGDFGALSKIQFTYAPVANTLQENFAEIELATKTRKISGIGFQENKPLQEDQILVADNNFFSIFNIEFLHGTAPETHKNIALSQRSAIRYFGDISIVGQILHMKIWGEKMSFIVSGVFEDLPSNTFLEADFIIPGSIGQVLQWDDSYGSTNYLSYVLLHPQVNFKQLNNKILEQIDLPVEIKDAKVGLVPFKRLHLHEAIAENNEANLYMLMIGAIVTLLISCFNYINLSTILFATRLKEVGIKKSFGANRRTIFIQFIFDTGFTAVIAAVIAILIISYILPQFNSMLSVGVGLHFNFTVLAIILGILLITILLAGVYPAISSSFFKPVTLMQGGSKNIDGLGKKRLSNFLITAQFVVAVMLLQIILLMDKQTTYMFRTDVTGFSGENVLCLNGREWGDLSTMKQELIKEPGVEKVSWGSIAPSLTLNLSNDWKTEENEKMAIFFECENDFLDVFNIQMIKGRFFSEEFVSDVKESVVINELAAKELEFKNPIGEKLFVKGKQYEIVGVVDNFQAVPPIFDDMPLIIEKADPKENYLFVKVDPEIRQSTHKRIEKVLHRANPEQPVNFSYYEDITTENAKSYEATFVVSRIFGIIIIINGMMGIFGLSYFVARRKIKEIGIRKVCGASMQHLIWTLGKGFLFKLLIAFIIATPFIYVFGQGFLSTFPRHITLGPTIFLTGGLLSFIMLLISAGWNLLKVSLVNPARMLRHE